MKIIALINSVQTMRTLLLLLLLLQGVVYAQTTINIPACANCPTSTSALAKGSSSICPSLVNAIDIEYGENGTIVFIAPDSTLWIMNPILAVVGDGVHTVDADPNGLYPPGFASSMDYTKVWDPTFEMPTRVQGPGKDAVKFTKILYVYFSITVMNIVAATATGDSWVYGSYPGGTLDAGGYDNQGANFTLNQKAHDTQFYKPTDWMRSRWYRLTTPQGKNITQIKSQYYDFEAADLSTGWYLDASGQVWAAGGCYQNNADNGVSYAGLSGAFCGVAGDNWAKLTIPNNDVIVDMATLKIPGTGGFLKVLTLLRSATGKVYAFGNLYGAANVPTLMTMPAGVKAVDIEQTSNPNGRGVYMLGDNGKLYYIGDEPQLSRGAGAPCPTGGLVGSCSSSVTFTEIAKWTAKGQFATKIFPVDGNNLFVFTNTNKLYFAAQTFVGDYSAPTNAATPLVLPNLQTGNPLTNLQVATNFTLYNTLPGANLDLSSGIKKMAPIYPGVGLFILTNKVLAYAGGYLASGRQSGNSGGYYSIEAATGVGTGSNGGTIFPNFHFYQECDGNLFDVLANKGYWYNTATMSTPPTFSK